MIEAIRDAHAVAMERDDHGRRVRRGRRLLRRRVPLHARACRQRFGEDRCFDAPINEAGIVGAAIGMAAYGLRPCVEIQFADYMYPGLRPDRVGGGPPAPPVGRRLHRADHRPHADRRRHLRRPDPLAEPRGAVHPRRRVEDRGPVEPVRREGAAARGDRGRRPGDLPRAEAALQRPVRRPPRPARSCPWSQHPLGEVPEGHYTMPTRHRPAVHRAGPAS